MPVPSFSKVLAGAFKGTIKSTPLGGLAGGLANAITGEGSDKPKRHRRKSLTKGQMQDVVFLKTQAGPKAVENYLLGVYK